MVCREGVTAVIVSIPRQLPNIPVLENHTGGPGGALLHPPVSILLQRLCSYMSIRAVLKTICYPFSEEGLPVVTYMKVVTYIGMIVRYVHVEYLPCG